MNRALHNALGQTMVLTFKPPGNDDFETTAFAHQSDKPKTPKRIMVVMTIAIAVAVANGVILFHIKFESRRHGSWQNRHDDCDEFVRILCLPRWLVAKLL